MLEERILGGCFAVVGLLGIAMLIANRIKKDREKPRKSDRNYNTLINNNTLHYNQAKPPSTGVPDFPNGIEKNKYHELLQDNWPYICQNTSDLPALLTHCFGSGLVSLNDMEHIGSCTTTITKNDYLYNCILKGIDEEKFEKFIEALCATTNEHIANRLRPPQIPNIFATVEHGSHTKDKSSSDVGDALKETTFAVECETRLLLENEDGHNYSVFYDNNQQPDEKIFKPNIIEFANFFLEVRKNCAGKLEMIKIIGKENQQITPHEIVEIVSLHRDTVEELILDKIYLKGTHFSRRLFLPKLRKFSFNNVGNHRLENQIQINDFYSKVDELVYDMIFFRKFAHFEDEKDLNALIPYLTEIDVDIVVGGMIILRIKPREIVSGLEHSNVLLRELLKKESQCESISLTNPHGKVSGLNLLFPCLKRLLIYEVAIDDIQSFF